MKPIRKDARLLDGSECSAIFSGDERHRYILTKKFPGHVNGSGHPLFLMLNPSTATHEVSDPTVTRCAGFARSWGYTAFIVANLFSLRSTDPRALKGDKTAEGDPENWYSIARAAGEASIVICAWGVHGELRNRARAVLDGLRSIGDLRVPETLLTPKLHCLGVTKDGHPKHPLYLPASAQPVRYDGLRARAGRKTMVERKCEGCDQPMLPDGEVKRENEYDHAQGCPMETNRKGWTGSRQ